MKTLRQSALRAYLECPAKFYLQYILGVEGIPSHHLEFGTAYHKAAEHFHRGEGYNEAILEGYPFAPDFFRPDQIEVRFFLPAKHPFADKELSVPISGMIDAVTPDGLYDHKTSTKPYNQKKVDAPLGMESYFGLDTTGIQATFYIWAYWLMTGRLVPFTYVIRRKNPGPRTEKFQTFTTTRTLEDIAMLWGVCDQMLDDVLWQTEWPCKCYNKQHDEVMQEVKENADGLRSVD